MLASALLYSDGNLHLLQRKGDGKDRVISLSCLADGLSTIKSVLSSWAQKDIFFFSLSIPTACLVAVLSDAAGDDTWNDEYLCLNATVKKAVKDNDGFRFTGLDSRAIWPVNNRGDKVLHVPLSQEFTLVASVTIDGTPSGNTPLLTAMLASTASNHAMGLSYSHNKKWETMFQDSSREQQLGAEEGIPSGTHAARQQGLCVH
ncbi:trans-sialidase, putative [Trypanosoma cruzi marinkellei]|uniref:Trans-sialidase, putative n=1 Tax=Trypanosoma cruzi marinkellei TaxID=85056 RepID=K2MV55_TRYCR|nr:trans-sialidase, putative [Trypanosoma cruzi marinkellei]